jgi:uncharacterized membrane protein YkgB
MAQSIKEKYKTIDKRNINWMSKHGIRLLRISIGIVFFWFGFLKFFPGLSPAEAIAGKTISTLTVGIVSEQAGLMILAIWECLIGIGLLVKRYLRIVILLLIVQMAGTLTPLFLFPHDIFTKIPYAPTLEGQYILKNIVLMSAAIVIGSRVNP